MATKKKCEICGKKWWARADAKTCSVNCKQTRAYRRRKLAKLKEGNNDEN